MICDWSFMIFRLIIKSSFDINLLIWLEYSISIFWLNLNTQFQHSDSTWYWSQVDTRFEFSTQLIKKSKMTLNVKIYYFWIYYIIIFERLTWNKWIYFSSRCLHYSVALSDTQIDISSTSLHVLMSRVENFKSILDFNLLTQLKYSSQEFWLESSFDESSTRLELEYSTW